MPRSFVGIRENIFTVFKEKTDVKGSNTCTGLNVAVPHLMKRWHSGSRSPLD